MKQSKILPKRHETDPAYHWKIEDLFASDDDWKKACEKINILLPALKDFKGHLHLSSEKLFACLQLNDEINQKLEEIYVYAHMKLHEDTTNAHYQGLAQEATNLRIKANSALSFIVPEILSLSDGTLEEYMKTDNKMKLYHHYLESIVRQKEHILSAELEQLLSEAGILGQAPQKIYNMINEADLKFPTVENEKGETVEITKGRFIQLLESSNRNVRKNTFEKVYDTYNKQRNTLAATLSASIQSDVFFARQKKYDTALEAALDENRIPTIVYDQLIETVHRHLPLMHRYMELRKKRLGVDELHMYDLYTPIVKNVDWDIPFEEAKQITLKGLAPLGDEYIHTLQKGYQKGWIDVYENAGKRSGAYSWGAYGTHPYVLMNYQNTVNHLFTLAHEMGHALHSYYSDEAQPYVYAGYKIFVAEVASTVNEALLMEYLLQNAKGPKEKAYLLNYFMEQFRGTLYRQTMFAEFEKITHSMVEEGKSLTADILCDLYGELNRKYYGPHMVVDPQIHMEWARIPHFYRGFYVYQYATGYSAAIALSQRILHQGPCAVEDYLGFLKSGNSDYPIEVLKKAGVDMSSSKPVEKALQVFGSLLEQMEEL
ncbi:MAG: oligoendopeptidase F [Epulopiscium sp.]|nr:oligoendopeptidase F [Candidatus Epulonipiscium sp.]